MPHNSEAKTIRQQLLAENRSKVAMRKAERLFISELSPMNFKLRDLSDIKKEYETMRIKAADRIVDSVPSNEIEVWPSQEESQEAIRCVRMFPANVRSIETTHGGATLWTAEEDGSIGIRNGFDGKIAFRIETPENTHVECFFSTETTMWVGMSDGQTRIYDQQVFVLAFEGHAHEGPITAFAQSFDEKTFSASEDGSVVKWDCEANSFEVLSRITDFGCPQRCLCCYGYTLFVGGDDGVVRSFDSETSALLRNFAGHTQCVNSISVMDGFLFTASYDKTLSVWNIGTGNCVKTIEGQHDAPITGMISDPISHHLWAADESGTTKIYSSKPESGFGLIRSLHFDHPVNIRCMKGLVAIDAAKLWTLGSDGWNKMWHSSRNRIEEAVKDSLKIMKSVIDQDEIELAKWADLLKTLREVAAKLSIALSELTTTNVQQSIYYTWLRYVFFSKIRKTKIQISAKLSVMSDLRVMRPYFTCMIQSLFKKKRDRSKKCLATLLEVISVHRAQYDTSRRLQQFVGFMKQACMSEKCLATLLETTDFLHKRRAFNTWEKLIAHRKENKKKIAMACALALAGEKATQQQYYAMWARFARLAPQRNTARKLADSFLKNNTKNLIKRFYMLWRRYTLASLCLKSKNNALMLLMGGTDKGMKKYFYEKWRRFGREKTIITLAKNHETRKVALEGLRITGAKLNALMERKRLIAEAQEAIDAASSIREENLKTMKYLEENNIELANDIANKNFAKHIEIERTPQEQVEEMIVLLKSKLFNFHTDYTLIEKVVDKCKKATPSAIFIESYNQVKRVACEIAKKPITSLECDWGLTDVLVSSKMKSTHSDTVFIAAKTMIIAYDIMARKERSGLLSSSEDIALSCKAIELLANGCAAIRLKKSS
eukprot:Tbor_TRINITY_DN390_c0_g1::TRINITY_DN390_c0_g1_i1::g.15513::m.15513